MVKFSFGRKHTNEKNKPLTTGGKIGGTLFFFVFFAMGMAFELFIGWEFSKAIRQRFWKQIPCKIITSTIEEKPKTNSPYTFKVSYEYEFNARKHTSTVYKRGYKGADEYHKADKIAKRFPPGKNAECYVNPSHAPEAVLKRGSLLFGFVLLFPLIFVAVGAIGIYAMWFSRDKKGKIKPIASKSLRTKRKNVGMFLFCISALIGVAMFYPVTIRLTARTIDARNWHETPCKILSAKVRSHRGDDSTTYSVHIFYEYQFQGQTYKSSRYGLSGGSSSGRAGKVEVVDAYKKAKNPVCYVNPKNPSEAVLQRGYSLALLAALVPPLFFAIGVGGIISIKRRKKKGLRSTAPGPVILKARYSPLTKLLVIIAFAAFWNGIVSIGVSQAIKSFQRGRPEWSLTFIMIPFVLVGLGAIVFVIYQFLALFNPRVTLKLSSAAIPLGGAAELSWTVSGRRGVIDAFKISLQGREPQNLMHSFEATNNKIIWELQVHGDIKKWPDIKQNHKIEIKPKPIDN